MILKKILSILTLFSTLLVADATIYMGGGYMYANESLDQGGSNSNNAVSLKIGYGDIKAYAVELSIDYIDNKSKIYMDDDGAKYGLNIAVLKSFNFDWGFYPFLRAGFGTGMLDSKADNDNNSVTYGSFNLGGGIFYPLFEHMDLEVAYEHRSTSYEKIDNSLEDYQKSAINIGYVGVNFRF